MNINFERNRAQIRCEAILGCTDNPEKWKSLNFDSFLLTETVTEDLKKDLILDAKDYYFKGALSLCEAINSVKRKYFSWATVKAYYSVFYLLTCTFAVKGYALIRKRGLYLIKAERGEKPHKKANRKYSTDHEGTINYYQDIFKNSDILLGNQIEDSSPYLWLMKRREQINYRERVFNEPNCSEFWEYIHNKVLQSKLPDLLINYINDNYIYCFQENHAVLALPIKRALLSRKELEDSNIINPLDAEKSAVLSNLFDHELSKTNLINLLC